MRNFLHSVLGWFRMHTRHSSTGQPAKERDWYHHGNPWERDNDSCSTGQKLIVDVIKSNTNAAMSMMSAAIKDSHL
jgi:hypothetical protein